MNPKDPRHPWSRLVAAARSAPDTRDAAAPFGFATRVAALAFTPDRRVSSLLERFAFRAVGIACLLAMASVAINYSSVSAPTPAEPHAIAAASDDAMAALLDT